MVWRENLVTGKERTNWYENHGSACTCADCTTKAAEQRRFANATNNRKVKRNEKCPCGSDVKYKKCHGS
jgi:uncharacterized protein YchJ